MVHATYIFSGRLRRSLYGEKADIDSNAPSRSSRRVLACKSLSNIAYIIHTISGRVCWSLRRAYTLDIRLGSTLSGTPRRWDAALNLQLARVVRDGKREICRILRWQCIIQSSFQNNNTMQESQSFNYERWKYTHIKERKNIVIRLNKMIKKKMGKIVFEIENKIIFVKRIQKRIKKFYCMLTKILFEKFS